MIREFEAFDTLNVVNADADEALLGLVVDYCLDLHGRFNRFSSGSELAALELASGKWAACSPDLALMLAVAKALHEESDGAFNIGMASVSDAWNAKDAQFKIPNGESVASALADCDFSQVSIRENQVWIPAGMKLDLGGIVKGYAAERVASFLVEQGVESGFVNLGGTIAVIGPRADGSKWTFGLQEPGAGHGEKFWARIGLAHGAIATSSSCERSAEVDGKHLHHIIDPRTGAPACNGLMAVSVFCEGAMMADALSTALFVLGFKRGIQLAQDLHAEALFRFEDDSVVMTNGFPASLVRGVGKRDDFEVVRPCVAEREDDASMEADAE